jgi:PleD family two-component response regulator
MNTDHGNPAADRLLGAVIDVVARVVHGKGRPYLHGNGDEFAVLLPNASLEEATATAQRICADCRRIAISAQRRSRLRRTRLSSKPRSRGRTA